MNGHWCPIHETVFFKKGKMRGYAHPIKDANGEATGEWCNEEGEPQPVPEEHKAEVEAQENGQAVGMTTKEIGDHIRAGTLSTVFGKTIAVGLTVWYRGRILGITKISFDGKDLPKFE